MALSRLGNIVKKQKSVAKISKEEQRKRVGSKTSPTSVDEGRKEARF